MCGALQNGETRFPLAEEFAICSVNTEDTIGGKMLGLIETKEAKQQETFVGVERVFRGESNRDCVMFNEVFVL